MTSTRSKNTRGNYVAEQNALERYRQYDVNINGVAHENPAFAGDGLLMGKMSLNELAFNGSAIESQLFGIGSTNLVSALPTITPQIKHLNSLSIFEKNRLIMPEPLRIQPNQRLMYLN